MPLLIIYLKINNQRNGAPSSDLYKKIRFNECNQNVTTYEILFGVWKLKMKKRKKKCYIFLISRRTMILMNVFTQPLCYRQDVTQGQFLREVCIYPTPLP